jgi:hypothetical protein
VNLVKGNKNQVHLPLSYSVYGVIIYWISIIAALICTLAPILAIAFPDRNVLNPEFLFSTIWQGKKPDAVWQTVGGGFPGGHFWIHNLTYGDGIVQFGLVLGCSCAGIALLGTAIAYLKERPRSYGWTVLCLVISTLIALAAAGIYQQGA